MLRVALEYAKLSKDPSTKVGAIIIGPDREVRSMGFNGFPRGIEDTDLRLCDKEKKYKLIVHAELNAILGAARNGTPLKGCSMYVAPISSRAEHLGGPPCIRCTVELIQAGIIEVVGMKQMYDASRWKEDQGYTGLSVALLKEAKVRYREIDLSAE